MCKALVQTELTKAKVNVTRTETEGFIELQHVHLWVGNGVEHYQNVYFTHMQVLLT